MAAIPARMLNGGLGARCPRGGALGERREGARAGPAGGGREELTWTGGCRDGGDRQIRTKKFRRRFYLADRPEIGEPRGSWDRNRPIWGGADGSIGRRWN